MKVVNPITQMIEEFIRQQKEYTEKTLEEIITKYDFIVGSKECKSMLMEILPEGANIIYSPYIENPTTVHVVKKFNAIDLMYGAQEKFSSSVFDISKSKQCMDRIDAYKGVINIIDKYKKESEE